MVFEPQHFRSSGWETGTSSPGTGTSGVRCAWRWVSLAPVHLRPAPRTKQSAVIMERGGLQLLLQPFAAAISLLFSAAILATAGIT
ncbi:hypothetical protein KSP39_PZI021992 [Platanthera zijinensis]|uniref:Uncharacterized protein n=1 Tax=Platanthera zijinensis TaxID=2320716 RepID=A0AAP0FW55_9ASPA